MAGAYGPRSGPRRGRRGTGLVVGRAARRRRSSPWVSFLVRPLVALVVVALAAGIVFNLLTGQIAFQGATPPTHHHAGTTGTHGKSAGAAHSSGPAGGTTSGHGGTQGSSTKTSTGKGSSSGTTGRNHAPTGGKPSAPTRGKGAGTSGGTHKPPATHTKGATGAGKPHTPPKGAVTLAGTNGGTATYTATASSLSATLRVAWPTTVHVVADGKSMLFGTKTTGFVATYQASHTLQVFLGYPQGTQLTVDGHALGPFTGTKPTWFDITAHGG